MGHKSTNPMPADAHRKDDAAQAEQAARSDRRQTLIITTATILLIVAIIVAACFADSFGTLRPTETEGAITYQEFATDAPERNADMEAIRGEIDSMNALDFKETVRNTEYVKISVKDYGDIIIRLRSDIAPKTVENFQSLVAKGFYDGLTIHRVIKDFVIQSGDPKGDGSGGSDKTITGEFTSNGVQNDLSHIAGVITMARKADNYNSATSQFMICNGDASETLDGANAAFGYVVAGMETVYAITEVEVTAGSGEVSRPVTPVVIEKICFVTKSASVATPETNG